MLLGRYLREVFKAHLEFVLCCWYATLEKYSRHTWNFFVLLVRYLREVFKAHLEFVLCCWDATLEKYSRHTWSLFCAAGTLP